MVADFLHFKFNVKKCFLSLHSQSKTKKGLE